jgi:hypothetical protein
MELMMGVDLADRWLELVRRYRISGSAPVSGSTPVYSESGHL